MQYSKNNLNLGRESLRELLLSVTLADFSEISGQALMKPTASINYRQTSPDTPTRDFSTKEGNDKAKFIVKPKYMNKRGN